MYNRSLSIQVFFWAFFLNFLWEHWHARYYSHFLGGPIPEWTLIGAAFLDAFWITLVYVAANKMFSSHTGIAFAMICGGLIVSIIGEWLALATGLWNYAPTMIIIPILNTGLTPTIQLGLLGFLSFALVHILPIKKLRTDFSVRS